jgi:hypothetical protein
VASDPQRPVICSPIGRRSAVKPQGTDMAGKPSVLIGPSVVQHPQF